MSTSNKVTFREFFHLNFKVISELFHDYRKQTTILIFISIFVVFINYLDLKFIEYITNNITLLVSNYSNFNSIIVNVLLFLIVLFVFNICQRLGSLLSQRYQSNITARVEQKLVDKLSCISYESYESSSFYEKMNLASQICNEYPNAIWGVSQILNIGLSLIIYTYLLSKTGVIFIFFILITILICFGVSSKITDLQLDYWRKNVSPKTRKNNYFRSIFSDRVSQNNIQINRSFRFFNSKYKYFNQEERKNYVKLNIFSFCTEIVVSVLFILVFCFTVLFVGQSVASGTYELGYFTMIMMMLINLFMTVKQFLQFMLNQNWYVRVLGAYYDIIESKDNLNLVKDNISEGVVLENLSYKYPQSKRFALRGISNSFKIGEKIAIVGKNGSGKTTMISVILGLLKNITGGCYISDSNIVAILQDFNQYQMTVKENIEIGCSGKVLSEDKIIEILKKIGLYDFINSKPDGIYTKLGQLEGGIELSKGQWQRLAIGRLLANDNANIWILDEPTAYLDPIAEIEMYKFIYKISEGKLVFFISHRLGFAQNADRIIVIDDGNIEEEGTHKELIDKKGLYQKMFSAQKEWYV